MPPLFNKSIPSTAICHRIDPSLPRPGRSLACKGRPSPCRTLQHQGRLSDRGVLEGWVWHLRVRWRLYVSNGNVRYLCDCFGVSELSFQNGRITQDSAASISIGIITDETCDSLIRRPRTPSPGGLPDHWASLLRARYPFTLDKTLDTVPLRSLLMELAIRYLLSMVATPHLALCGRL
nr:hypothetical protein CFP56_07834 [Quercus suber]